MFTSPSDCANKKSMQRLTKSAVLDRHTAVGAPSEHWSTHCGPAPEAQGSSGDPARAAERRRRDRRQARLSLVWDERRTGFDRRGPDAQTAWGRWWEGSLRRLRSSPRGLLAVLVIANLLSVLDYFMTLNALNHGFGEANLVMRSLLEYDVRLAGVVKFGLVLGISVVVWRFRRFRSVLASGLLLLGFFAAVFVYQLFGLMFMV